MVFGGTYIVVQFPVRVNKIVRKEAHLEDCCKFTPFGLYVKTELLRRGITQTWLIQRMTGMTNRIDSNADLDGVLSTLTDGFAEALVTAAEGVHE